MRGLSGGPSIGPPWCRETPLSRTAISLISDVFPAKTPKIYSHLSRSLYIYMGTHAVVQLSDRSGVSLVWLGDPPESPRTITALYGVEGFKEALKSSPIMPRDDSNEKKKMLNFFATGTHLTAQPDVRRVFFARSIMFFLLLKKRHKKRKKKR